MKDFKEKFKIDDLKIKQIGNWVISVRPKQITIGSLVLSLNRKCATFAELTVNEGKDLVEAFKYIEDLLKNSFNPNKINYLALMMMDEQVHYHVIPRYKEEINWEGSLYKDKDWPKPPVLNDLGLTEEKTKKLFEYLNVN